MDWNRENRLLKSNIIILGLCLCSIVLCILADPMIHSENNHYGGSGGNPGHTHFDEHEDDFVLMNTASANTQAAEIQAKISAHLSNSSHFTSPITPPPKSH